MIYDLVSLAILIAGIGVIFWLLLQLPMLAPFAQIIKIVGIVICLLLVVGFLFGGVEIPRIRWARP